MGFKAVKTEPASGPVFEPMKSTPADIGGGMMVQRALPRRERRTIGPWCFVDMMGPAPASGLSTGEHPHIGLQTVTWLLEGEGRHLDTLGSDQMIRPGQLNLMTAGHGIAHAEIGQTITQRVHGVQLWTALPDSARQGDPAFQHIAALPQINEVQWSAHVLMGTAFGQTSPAHSPWPIVGAQIALSDGGRAILPLEGEFEYGVLPLDGGLTIEGQPIEGPGLTYLGRGRSQVSVTTDAASRLLLLGGAPFEEPILMWWNFVARDYDEIREARRRWMDREFPAIPNYQGDWIPAPVA